MSDSCPDAGVRVSSSLTPGYPFHCRPRSIAIAAETATFWPHLFDCGI